MFLCCLDTVGRQQRSLNNEIEKQLKKDKKDGQREYKLLLLGAGESGKTTFMTQMKIISGKVFTREELLIILQIIKGNIADSVFKIDQQLKLRGLHLSQNCPIQDVINAGVDLKSNHELTLTIFWNDAAVQKVYLERGKYYVLDSFKYFMIHIHRILKDDYVPTEQDVLQARKATTGVQEYRMYIDCVIFRLVDVGGQRSERRKWIHCFGSITCIIFIAAASEYDQVLAESPDKNRMEESIALFNTILSYELFDDKSMILFLNKKDLLEEKIKVTPLDQYFPDFAGPYNDHQAALEFILELFLEGAKQQSKVVFHHFTCATDTEAMRIIFNSVKMTVLQQNLRNYYFV